MAILTVNSHVAVGHVGNSATVLPLQCLGFEAWPVHTTLLSNHPGHGQAHGQAVAPAVVAEVLAGIAARGGLARLEAVLSGYLASPETGAAVLGTVAAAKAAAPAALFCCDPVLGDAREGLYVAEALARWIADEAVAAADIVTPNRFELAYLSGRPADSEPQALAAARALIARGPRLVLATSIDAGDAAAGGGRIATLAVTADAAWRVTTPKLASRAKGAGDVLAALFLAHTLKGGDAGAALDLAVSSVFGLIAAAGPEALDLPVVAAAAQITRPGTRFHAEVMPNRPPDGRREPRIP